MTSYKMGTVIAERLLEIANEDRVVRVLMGFPQKIVQESETYYICPIQVLGIGDEQIRAARGEDAFQAIELGLQLIGIELYVKLNPKWCGTLRWNGEADLSFPLPESVADFKPKLKHT